MSRYTHLSLFSGIGGLDPTDEARFRKEQAERAKTVFQDNIAQRGNRRAAAGE